VRDYRGLRDHLQTKSPGEEMKLKVRRGEKTVEMTVVLGRYEGEGE
jgi:S1-C subfamily serine protease